MERALPKFGVGQCTIGIATQKFLYWFGLTEPIGGRRTLSPSDC